MIKTLSMCDVCYKKIPAEIVFIDGAAWMHKECEVHGKFEALVDPDAQHVSNFYQYGTLGRNNTIIVHAHNECNMKCDWCYYPMGQEKMHPMSYYHALLGQYRGFNLLLSGGEPLLRPDYFKFVREGASLGWNMASITNMIQLADDEFFTQCLTPDLVQGNILKFAMSMQHPKNYSKEIFDQKYKALQNIERAGVKAMCVMFSIQSLDELDWIREFYNQTKHLYTMIRIRTMFTNWANKDGIGSKDRLFLSQLHKKFLEVFGDLNPIQSRKTEQSNMYCLYMEMDEGMEVSLSSAPTVENADYHLCSRPVYMLAMDGRCYPVPLAQITNEGIEKGWKDGFRLEGGPSCG